jgi:hypothetical protein
VVAGAGEAVVLEELEELELPFELAAGVALSDGFDASPPDLAASPFLAEAGFAEE